MKTLTLAVLMTLGFIVNEAYATGPTMPPIDEPVCNGSGCTDTW